MGALETVSGVLTKIFGSRNARLIKRYNLVAEQVGAIEETYRAYSDDELRGVTARLRERLKEGAESEDVLVEAFAAVREASRRAQDHRHYPCQLIGGQVLFGDKIAEMKTGEGKTIVCHLAAYLKVLSESKVFIVTVNDYLVRRDAEFAQPIFEMLGATVGYIQSQVDPGGHQGIRREQYACDLVYGTNNEFGFDYLRDNMKMSPVEQVQARLDYCIIDEVDSILIDEARTPLIISGPSGQNPGLYKWADDLARFLVRKQGVANNETANRLREWGDLPPKELTQNPKFNDATGRFRVDPLMLTEDEADAILHKQYFVCQRDRKAANLTHDGVAAAQEEAGIGSFYVGANMDRPHLIENAIRAHVVYERDKEYVVQDREVIIVDEFTGRLMVGRQWSDGLHQAVEAKEGVPVKEETQTLATITIQNYFKIFKNLAGMTGTAMTEANEFMKIYKLDCVSIPTARPVNRGDYNDKMYQGTASKYKAIVEEIHEYHRRGRPGDPWLLAEILEALKPIREKEGADTGKIAEALKQFKKADEGDDKLLSFMLEAYDEAMGDLAVGRPILVGTTSVENSEKLSKELERTYGIEHEVLNAKNHAREAEIVTKAGHQYEPARGKDKVLRGNVTIATNMAGRGTDIKLGLKVVYPRCVGDLAPREPGVIATKCCIYCEDYDAKTNCAHCFKPKVDPRFPAMGRNVCAKNSPCGLHIIGTERHESRRIDNQLRGRAGRQGDPGSSRFFLSLEDDLLKMFMPDWMLKMMEKLGLSGGASLEDKSLTKGIEKAQKKVEERNFASRKNLLEWDEPMDYQRKTFYSERQRILEGVNLRSLIWRLIDSSVEESVGRYMGETYRSKCISDWCRSQFELEIDVSRIDADQIEEVQEMIRRRAMDDARDRITTNMGEYIDDEMESAEWDLGGMLKWAQRAYEVSLTQNQLRKMNREEIADRLVAAAEKYYAKMDLEPLEVYGSKTYPVSAMADWTRAKFAIEIDADELRDKQEGEVLDLLSEKIRASYRQREIEYPVNVILERAFGQDSGGSSFAAAHICQWANFKYRLGWTVEEVQTKSAGELRAELVAINEAFISNGKLAAEVDEALSQHEGEALMDWAKERFGPALQGESLQGESIQGNGEDLRERLISAGRELARYELTMLERYVLLRIYDQAWKDHLLEMDHLKHAIMQRPLGGDQTHPQSQYAIEGREYFDQMWDVVRERVTDTIFKVRLSGGDGEGAGGGAGPGGMQMNHADSTGSGFAGGADQAAAMRAQGEGRKVETIRREEPKVGRNDPCPCGSGKKYKQCHGKKG